MEKLQIVWQRLVDEGETCPRCKQTGEEVQKAVSTLKKSLKPMNIDVIFEKKELSVEEFKESPLQSNRITLNGKSLEEWLNADTGKSPCCDVCGPTECRTTEIDGETYEDIPAELIVKAGLAAVFNLSIEKKNNSCCDGSGKNKDSGCCCKEK